MSNKRALLLVIVLALAIAACSPSAEKERDESPAAATNTPATAAGVYQTLTIDAFADILANHADDYTIINVHIPYEGEIEGSDANVAYNDLDALTAALPDKNAPIILYCRSGNMSRQASQALLERGYTQVWDVLGGMIAWQESGRELVNR
jgi:rhodanese-related sulfurtransferase